MCPQHHLDLRGVALVAQPNGARISPKRIKTVSLQFQHQVLFGNPWTRTQAMKSLQQACYRPRPFPAPLRQKQAYRLMRRRLGERPLAVQVGQTHIKLECKGSNQSNRRGNEGRREPSTCSVAGWRFQSPLHSKMDGRWSLSRTKP